MSTFYTSISKTFSCTLPLSTHDLLAQVLVLPVVVAEAVGGREDVEVVDEAAAALAL